MQLQNWIKTTVSGAYEIKKILELLYDNFGDRGHVDYEDTKSIINVFDGIKEGQEGSDYHRYIKKIENYNLGEKMTFSLEERFIFFGGKIPFLWRKNSFFKEK